MDELAWIALVCAACYARRAGALDLSLGPRVGVCWLLAAWMNQRGVAPLVSALVTAGAGALVGGLLECVASKSSRRPGSVELVRWLVVAVVLAAAVDQVVAGRWLARDLAVDSIDSVLWLSLVVGMAGLLFVRNTGGDSEPRRTGGWVPHALSGWMVGVVALASMPDRAMPGVDWTDVVAAVLVAVSFDPVHSSAAPGVGRAHRLRVSGGLLGLAVLVAFPWIDRMAGMRDGGSGWVLLATGLPSLLLAALGCDWRWGWGSRATRADRFGLALSWVGLGAGLSGAALTERGVIGGVTSLSLGVVGYGAVVAGAALLAFGFGALGALLAAVIGGTFVGCVMVLQPEHWLGPAWLLAGASAPTLLAIMGLLAGSGASAAVFGGGRRSLGLAALGVVGVAVAIPSPGCAVRWGLTVAAMAVLAILGYARVTRVPEVPSR